MFGRSLYSFQTFSVLEGRGLHPFLSVSVALRQQCLMEDFLATPALRLWKTRLLTSSLFRLPSSFRR